MKQYEIVARINNNGTYNNAAHYFSYLKYLNTCAVEYISRLF